MMYVVPFPTQLDHYFPLVQGPSDKNFFDYTHILCYFFNIFKQRLDTNILSLSALPTGVDDHTFLHFMICVLTTFCVMIKGGEKFSLIVFLFLFFINLSSCQMFQLFFSHNAARNDDCLHKTQAAIRGEKTIIMAFVLFASI